MPRPGRLHGNAALGAHCVRRRNTCYKARPDPGFVLTLKFGPVPAAILAHVESADAETLLRWSERVLSADDLEEVFGS
jgi:hypothetical protein